MELNSLDEFGCMPATSIIQRVDNSFDGGVFTNVNAIELTNPNHVNISARDLCFRRVCIKKTSSEKEDTFPYSYDLVLFGGLDRSKPFIFRLVNETGTPWKVRIFKKSLLYDFSDADNYLLEHGPVTVDDKWRLEELNVRMRNKDNPWDVLYILKSETFQISLCLNARYGLPVFEYLLGLNYGDKNDGFNDRAIQVSRSNQPNLTLSTEDLETVIPTDLIINVGIILLKELDKVRASEVSLLLPDPEIFLTEGGEVGKTYSLIVTNLCNDAPIRLLIRSFKSPQGPAGFYRDYQLGHTFTSNNSSSTSKYLISVQRTRNTFRYMVNVDRKTPGSALCFKDHFLSADFNLERLGNKCTDPDYKVPVIGFKQNQAIAESKYPEDEQAMFGLTCSWETQQNYGYTFLVLRKKPDGPQALIPFARLMSMPQRMRFFVETMRPNTVQTIALDIELSRKQVNPPEDFDAIMADLKDAVNFTRRVLAKKLSTFFASRTSRKIYVAIPEASNESKFSVHLNVTIDVPNRAQISAFCDLITVLLMQAAEAESPEMLRKVRKFVDIFDRSVNRMGASNMRFVGCSKAAPNRAGLHATKLRPLLPRKEDIMIPIDFFMQSYCFHATPLVLTEPEINRINDMRDAPLCREIFAKVASASTKQHMMNEVANDPRNNIRIVGDMNTVSGQFMNAINKFMDENNCQQIVGELLPASPMTITRFTKAPQFERSEMVRLHPNQELHFGTLGGTTIVGELRPLKINSKFGSYRYCPTSGSFCSGSHQCYIGMDNMGYIYIRCAASNCGNLLDGVCICYTCKTSSSCPHHPKGIQTDLYTFRCMNPDNPVCVKTSEIEHVQTIIPETSGQLKFDDLHPEAILNTMKCNLFAALSKIPDITLESVSFMIPRTSEEISFYAQFGHSRAVPLFVGELNLQSNLVDGTRFCPIWSAHGLNTAGSRKGSLWIFYNDGLQLLVCLSCFRFGRSACYIPGGEIMHQNEELHGNGRITRSRGVIPCTHKLAWFQTIAKSGDPKYRVNPNEQLPLSPGFPHILDRFYCRVQLDNLISPNPELCPIAPIPRFKPSFTSRDQINSQLSWLLGNTTDSEMNLETRLNLYTFENRERIKKDAVRERQINPGYSMQYLLSEICLPMSKIQMAIRSDPCRDDDFIHKRAVELLDSPLGSGKTVRLHGELKKVICCFKINNMLSFIEKNNFMCDERMELENFTRQFEENNFGCDPPRILQLEELLKNTFGYKVPEMRILFLNYRRIQASMQQEDVKKHKTNQFVNLTNYLQIGEESKPAPVEEDSAYTQTQESDYSGYFEVEQENLAAVDETLISFGLNKNEGLVELQANQTGHKRKFEQAAEIPAIACCMNSLKVLLSFEIKNRVNSNGQKISNSLNTIPYECVIVDEFSSMVSQFNSDLLAKTVGYTFAIITQFLAKAKILIVADGNFSAAANMFLRMCLYSSETDTQDENDDDPRALQNVSNLQIAKNSLTQLRKMDPSEEVQYLKNESVFGVHENVRYDFYADRNTMLCKISIDLKQKKKVFCFFASLKTMGEVKVLLKANCSANLSVFELYGGSLPSQKNKVVADAPGYWSTHQLVMSTTAMPAGFSYDPEVSSSAAFDSVYLFLDPNSSDSQCLAQMTSRIRHIRDGIVNIYCPGKHGIDFMEYELIRYADKDQYNSMLENTQTQIKQSSTFVGPRGDGTIMMELQGTGQLAQTAYNHLNSVIDPGLEKIQTANQLLLNETKRNLLGSFISNCNPFVKKQMIFDNFIARKFDPMISRSRRQISTVECKQILKDGYVDIATELVHPSNYERLKPDASWSELTKQSLMYSYRLDLNAANLNRVFGETVMGVVYPEPENVGIEFERHIYQSMMYVPDPKLISEFVATFLYTYEELKSNDDTTPFYLTDVFAPRNQEKAKATNGAVPANELRPAKQGIRGTFPGTALKATARHDIKATMYFLLWVIGGFTDINYNLDLHNNANVLQSLCIIIEASYDVEMFLLTHIRPVENGMFKFPIASCIGKPRTDTATNLGILQAVLESYQPGISAKFYLEDSSKNYDFICKRVIDIFEGFFGFSFEMYTKRRLTTELVCHATPECRCRRFACSTSDNLRILSFALYYCSNNRKLMLPRDRLLNVLQFPRYVFRHSPQQVHFKDYINTFRETTQGASLTLLENVQITAIYAELRFGLHRTVIDPSLYTTLLIIDTPEIPDDFIDNRQVKKDRQSDVIAATNYLKTHEDSTVYFRASFPSENNALQNDHMERIHFLTSSMVTEYYTFKADQVFFSASPRIGLTSEVFNKPPFVPTAQDIRQLQQKIHKPRERLTEEEMIAHAMAREMELQENEYIEPDIVHDVQNAEDEEFPDINEDDLMPMDTDEVDEDVANEMFEDYDEYIN